jgi:hypothetical protein
VRLLALRWKPIHSPVVCGPRTAKDALPAQRARLSDRAARLALRMLVNEAMLKRATARR